MARARPLCSLIVFAALCAQAGALAAAETVGPIGLLAGNGIERGVARLVCRGDAPRVWHQSRVFVIDTRAAVRGRDLLFAAAHGLPEDPARVATDCTVRGIHGRPAAIADVWRPESRGTLTDDWAILTTVAPLEGEVGRLRMAALETATLESLATHAAPVRLVLYADYSGPGDCQLLGRPWVQGQEFDYGIFAHSCRSRQGLSGAPIVVGVAGEPVAIGINLGYRMRPPQVEGPLFYGVGRAFDAEIAAAIERVAERAAAKR